MNQLARLAASPAAFRRTLAIDTDHGPRRLDGVLDAWQRADFESLDAGWRRVVGHDVPNATMRGYLERPRGHSKTADLAVMVLWCLFASCRRLSGVAAAADKDQARLLRDAIARLVSLNRWLTDVLDVQRDRIVNRHTGSELSILSSDAATSYGLTPDFIIVDELSHWPRRDLWDSLISSAAKRARCMVVVISNAGYGETWQWQTHEAIRADPAWYFSRLDGPHASWITPDRLAEQKRLLPAIAYERLWLNRWTAGAGDALDADDIAAAVTLAPPPAGPERGWTYVAGLDIGLTRDSTALAIIGRHDGYVDSTEEPDDPLPFPLAVLRRQGLLADQDGDFDYGEMPAMPLQKNYRDVVMLASGGLQLAALHVWTPGVEGRGRVSLEEVEQTIIRAAARWRLATVAFDPWQAALLVERLGKQQVHTTPLNFTPNNLQLMATATLEAFRERRLALFDHDRLMHDLRQLRIEERGYGMRLTSPRGPDGHGDCATALSIALAGLRRTDGLLNQTVPGELLCYP